jgi:Na+/H+ antiporter NhaD/arsenite permease-like protein
VPVSPQLPDLSGHWVGFAALAIFAGAYALVIAEEAIDLRKSKPVVVAAGILWVMIGAVHAWLGLSDGLEAALRHVFLEYAELLLFLLVAMTYVNALEERRVFDVLRARLVQAGLSYRALFWATGGLAFVISPFADNLTTALVMCAVVIALGREMPGFVALSCVNIVVAANAGGAFSPFGDITTLMVWQKGLVAFAEFFRLFVPSVANFIVPALIMHFAVPRGRPAPQPERVALKPGARRIALLFGATIMTAIGVHSLLHLPAVLGMMTGLGYLQLLDYFMQLRGRRRRPAESDAAVNVFHRLAAVDWDTLLFFYGVMMCVGALGLLGYLTLTSQFLYGGLGPTAANVLIGIASAVLDNIPLMYAVLTMQPDMPLGQWLLITLTTGVGGSLLSIGSAAGVALMGQARGIYTFMAHLRWTPAVAAGYAAAILVHQALNWRTF